MQDHVKLDYDRLTRRMDALFTLVDEIEAMGTRIGDVGARQHAGTWTDVGACPDYASNYRQTLNTTSTSVQAVRQRTEDVRAAMAAMSEDVKAQDEDAAARLKAAADRLGASTSSNW